MKVPNNRASHLRRFPSFDHSYVFITFLAIGFEFICTSHSNQAEPSMAGFGEPNWIINAMDFVLQRSLDILVHMRIGQCRHDACIHVLFKFLPCVGIVARSNSQYGPAHACARAVGRTRLCVSVIQFAGPFMWIQWQPLLYYILACHLCLLANCSYCFIRNNLLLICDLGWLWCGWKKWTQQFELFCQIFIIQRNQIRFLVPGQWLLSNLNKTR